MAVKGKGMKPLDAIEDFEKPTVIAGSPAADSLPEATAEPEPEEDFDPTVEDLEQEAEQMELPGTQTAIPPVIREGKMLAEFVRPHFDNDEGDRYVGFEISLALTPAHESNGHLPEEVLREWLHMREGNSKRIDVTSVAPQTLTIGLVPDDYRSDLVLVGATIENPVLMVVKDTGAGKSKTIIRFKFRAMMELESRLSNFAVQHFGDPIWFSMEPTQPTLEI